MSALSTTYKCTVIYIVFVRFLFSLLFGSKTTTTRSLASIVYEYWL